MAIQKIPQTDPHAIYQTYQAEINEAIQQVLDSGFYILGDQVESFEQEFATYIGARYGIGVASGTDALIIALRACGVGPGDVVLTVSHTAVATVAAIELVGATALLVDVEAVHFTLDPESLAAAIADVLARPSMGRLKAIVPVHLYGHPANLPAIMHLANQHHLYVIEDCSQAHGATLNQRRVGTWGHCAAFSCYPTKNLGAMGDAGIIVTQDRDLAEHCQRMRQYGWASRYISDTAGMNSRLDALQAAILRVKLKYLDADNGQRQAIARQYSENLQDFPLHLPHTSPGADHVYHQFVLRVNQRNALFTFLQAQGIGVALHYPLPVHQQPAYHRRLPLAPGGLPMTEQLSQEIISLPMHPCLSTAAVATTTAAIASWYEGPGEPTGLDRARAL
ncbi:MAG: DegT/DnrJ/EryC1/StrS family aminotransferase [Cyanobacteria bacterium REEB459]|nr:DegT/DnrJ/EryC1/StrS family aminotransferase [Cyanobacteria bacterium REEB459]